MPWRELLTVLTVYKAETYEGGVGNRGMYMFMRMLLFFFCFSAVHSDGAEEPLRYEILEDQAKVPLLTPALQGRQKRKICLKNGLEVLLISDQSMEKSGAMLSVLTGSWYDPEGAPGLAHFLEHMLFMGTTSYPEPGSFQTFVAQNGGINNAFTAGSHTSYLFSIVHQAFLPALQRFASFFIDPLLSAAGIERELHAIDQEYSKSLEDDDRREFYILQELYNPKHPKGRMAAGNTATLQHITTEQMRKWYEGHYSGDRMRLIVYSPLPLDELTDAVVADFSAIPRRATAPLPPAAAPLIGEAFGGRIAYIEPLRQLRRLALVWEVPAALVALRDSKPEVIASYLLGYEGDHSLLGLLKNEGLAEALSAGIIPLDRASALFGLEITLTDKGVKEWEKVLERIFQAIAFYRSTLVEKSLFDEISKMDKLRYQYQKGENTFSILMTEGSGIILEDLASYPEKMHMITDFNPLAIQQFFAALTPQSSLTIVMAPVSLTKVKLDKREKEMGIPYTVRRLAPPLLERLENAASPPAASYSTIQPLKALFTLPQKNPFIPDNLQLLDKEKLAEEKNSGPIPLAKKLRSDDSIALFWAPDRTFLLPKVSMELSIRSPQGGQLSPEFAVQTDLWVTALKEELNAFSYPAKLADLDYAADAVTFGVHLSIEGYSDKAAVLLAEIAKKMQGIQLNAELFNRYKQRLLRQYRSGPKEAPLTQAKELLRSALYRYYVTNEQKAKALSALELEPFNAFARMLLQQRYIQALFYGNLSQDQAEAAATQFLSSLSGAPYPAGASLRRLFLELPQDSGPYYLEKKIKVQGNAVILSIEIPAISFADQAVLQVVMQAIDAPFFDELRTVQQTGYIVASEFRVIDGNGLANFALQSASYAPRDLLARFELFLEGYLRKMGGAVLSLEEFEIIRNAVIQQLNTPPQTPQLMGMTLFDLAFTYEGDFARVNKQLEALRQMEYKSFVARAQQLLGATNRRRLAVAVEGVATGGQQQLHYRRLPSLEALRKLSKYTSLSNSG